MTITLPETVIKAIAKAIAEEIDQQEKDLAAAHRGYLDQIFQLQTRLTDIKNMVERLEIVSADKTTKAKEDWQRMIAKNHENSYATSLRYEVWRETATMFADLGAEIDKVMGGTGNENLCSIVMEK